jgi:hypothetical protein
MSLAEEFGVHEHCEFTIRTTGHPDRTIVQLRGELDLATRDELYTTGLHGLHWDQADQSGSPHRCRAHT